MSVVVQALSKRFGTRGEVAAVDGVSFAAPEHRITSLLGPSGSGKSTVLRAIAGLERPDAGSVLIDGRDVTNVPVREREIGFVFQNYALFRHMSVFDNVAFGLSVRNVEKSKIAERVDELLALVELSHCGKRLPDQLSGGQRQRVALARALAPNPRVLLLDEPFGALDTRVRSELRAWLHELHEKTQVTTLLVTHDQEEALELSEHVVILKSGRIEQAGAPDDLYEEPATPFVASFLGGGSRLQGRVKNGSADLGTSVVPVPGAMQDDSMVYAYVRPHDVTLRKLDDESTGPGTATVERLTRVGSHVKLVIAMNGGDVLAVQMLKQELEQRGITVGDRVAVDLNDVKVFAQDYAI